MRFRDEIVPHPDKPLYCFKIEQDSTIVKYTITDYAELLVSKHTGTFCYYFRFQFNGVVGKYYEARSRNMNRLINRKYYTFDGDEYTAAINIVKQLLSKKYELLTQLDNLDRLIDSVEDKNRQTLLQKEHI